MSCLQCNRPTRRVASTGLRSATGAPRRLARRRPCIPRPGHPGGIEAPARAPGRGRSRARARVRRQAGRAKRNCRNVIDRTSRGPPMDRKVVRHGQIPVVVVGDEVHFGQAAAPESINFVPRQRDRKGILLLGTFAAAARNDHVPAHGDQIRDRPCGPLATRSREDLDRIALIDQVETAPPSGQRSEDPLGGWPRETNTEVWPPRRVPVAEVTLVPAASHDTRAFRSPRTGPEQGSPPRPQRRRRER